MNLENFKMGGVKRLGTLVKRALISLFIPSFDDEFSSPELEISPDVDCRDNVRKYSVAQKSEKLYTVYKSKVYPMR
uniref:Uncharacterized protein n=1 Tax=Romanomermis culicivorax TaxID=13658 RepID=A0A915J5E7_ROMCU